MFSLPRSTQTNPRREPGLGHIRDEKQWRPYLNRSPMAGWYHRNPKVLRQLLVIQVEIGSIVTGFVNPAFDVVRDQDFRDTAEERQHPDVAELSCPAIGYMVRRPASSHILLTELQVATTEPLPSRFGPI